MQKQLLILLLLLTGCTKNNKTSVIATVLPVGVETLLSSYTKDKIDINETLKFRFNNAVISPAQIGSQVNEAHFDLSPKTQGLAVWTDPFTIEFKPEAPLKYSTNYQAQLHLENLIDSLPTELQTLQFNFYTNPLNLKVKFYDLEYEANSEDNILLSGKAITNNIISDDDLEKRFRVNQSGNDNLRIEWNHYSQKSRRFTISGIKRKKEPSKLSIEWNEGDNARKKNSRILDILPKGEFKLVKAQVDEKNKKQINLIFSDPLKRNQDLKGLIKIDKTKLKFEIVSNRILIVADQLPLNEFTININQNIYRTDGDKLNKKSSIKLKGGPVNPTLKLAGKGAVSPSNEKAQMVFTASNLKSATVEVFEIYPNNILQFLQYQQLDGSGNLNTVGNIIYQGKINIPQVEENLSEQVVAININKFITAQPKSIYSVRVAFDQTDLINFECSSTEEEPYTLDYNSNKSILSYNGYYDWSQRNNPCNPAYYNAEKFISKNILVSDFGMIFKTGTNNDCYAFITDINTTQPLGGVEVELFDFQQQPLGSSLSDSNGKAYLKLDKKPAFAILKSSAQIGYINLLDQHSNALSEFEVSGIQKTKGINGYLYAERDVWRPGDSIYLNFILEDAQNVLPVDHPINLTLTDSRSIERASINRKNNIGGIYHFPLSTKDSDPTGNWQAVVTVGNVSFNKNLKIENIKPNRLKVDLEVPDNKLFFGSNQNIKLNSEWLHGASASNLNAKLDLQLKASNTSFKPYTNYSFDDPSRTIESELYNIFDGKLDENGSATINLKKNKNWKPAGKLKANLKTRVYEKSGNFSEDNRSLEADFYASYVGIKLPRSRWGSKYVKTNSNTNIELVAVDKEGATLKNKKLNIGVYKVDWSWWYDRAGRNAYKYNSATHKGAIEKNTVNTNAEGKANYKINLSSRGTYLVRVCDEISGHCTGDVFYCSRYAYAEEENAGPELIKFKSDKSSYAVGEKIKLEIPSNQDGKIFISIENENKVINTLWVKAKKDLSTIEIPVTEDMTPNIYIHSHLVQPYASNKTDMPLRMYGVLPVSIINPNTVLRPTIKVADEVRPEETFQIKIEESKGNSMSYTLAVVDEGLLGLTNFKTPDPWSHFYAKRALGVKTWDLYDLMMQSSTNKINHFLSIGGDATLNNTNQPSKANRFKPVVKHLGPFYLKAGESAVHKIKLSSYVGAVRVMVVARNNIKYGSDQKTIKVKKPLMVQATLPRVLSPGESLDLPANVFAMEDNIKKVNLNLKTDQLVENNASDVILNFDRQGDKLEFFDINVGQDIGVTQFEIEAKSGNERAKQKVEVQIRNPNPLISKNEEWMINENEVKQLDFSTFGTKGTNKAKLEVSSIQPVNLEERLNYLIRYPYGCIEQTVSSVFPQLYLANLVDLDPLRKNEIEQNVQNAIERLSLFQLYSGGLSYWPGRSNVSDWGTNYALHFLLEAKALGYFIPSGMIDKIISYLENKTERESYPSSTSRYLSTTDTYSLYLLAKVGRPNIGAMNRLTKVNKKYVTANFFLATAYNLIGQNKVADNLLHNQDLTIKPYVESGYTYGSDLRDQAILTETYLSMNKIQDAIRMANLISTKLNSSKWYSTQSIAYALTAIGKVAKAFNNSEHKFEWSLNNSSKKIEQSSKPIYQVELDINEKTPNTILVKNLSSKPLFCKLVLYGKEAIGEEEPHTNKHINLKVRYVDMKNNILDPNAIKLGTDFKAICEITNLGTKGQEIEELVLNQPIPSGWEIQNLRLGSNEISITESSFEYRDIKDDQVNTFFDIYSEDKITYVTHLTASYAGRFYLPASFAEAMYDNSISAKTKGQWVTVIR